MDIQTDRAPEGRLADLPDPAPPPKPAYDWDRTVAERAEKEERERAARIPFPAAPATNVDFEKLCVYWNELQKLPVASFSKLYASRWWPVLLPVETTDDFGRPKESFPNDFIITKEDGELSEKLILQLAGVGEYRFRLNDSRRPWKQQTVVFSEFNIIEPSLWQLHPPIFDPKRLDMEAKRNQAYIKFARSHGYLREGEQEQNEMANEGIVSQLLQANKNLTEQVVKGVAAPAPLPPPAPVAAPAKVESNGNGEGYAIKAVADLAIAVMNKQSSDPASDLKGVIDLVKAITPQADTSAADLAKVVVAAKQASDDRNYELQKEQLTQMRAELKEARQATSATQVLPPEKPRTRKEMLEDAVAEQQLLKTLAGGRSSRGDEEPPEKPGFLEKYGEILPLIAQPISALFQGLLQTIQFGFHSYQVTSYNNALAKTPGGAAPMPPINMNPGNPPPQPGQPMAPQGPAPTPQQSEQEQMGAAIVQGVAKMTPYLIKHLDKGKSGAEFAEFIIENGDEERTTYDRIRALPESLKQIGVQVPGEGEVQFLEACKFVFQRYPPLWSKVGNHPTIKQFLTEFYNYDEIVAAAEAEDDKEKGGQI